MVAEEARRMGEKRTYPPKNVERAQFFLKPIFSDDTTNWLPLSGDYNAKIKNQCLFTLRYSRP